KTLGAVLICVCFARILFHEVMYILKRHFQKCSLRRGNPTGASHLSHSHAHHKIPHPGSHKVTAPGSEKSSIGDSKILQNGSSRNVMTSSPTEHANGQRPSSDSVSRGKNARRLSSDDGAGDSRSFTGSDPSGSHRQGMGIADHERIVVAMSSMLVKMATPTDLAILLTVLGMFHTTVVMREVTILSATCLMIPAVEKPPISTDPKPKQVTWTGMIYFKSQWTGGLGLQARHRLKVAQSDKVGMTGFRLSRGKRERIYYARGTEPKGH
ncbi:hypothetical protein FGG08_003957, partial [Glutinoglossum americanum]